MMALVTDCFNVLGPDGKAYMYVGSGSSAMAEQAATNTAGVVWVQEAAKTAFGAGGSLVAIALTCLLIPLVLLTTMKANRVLLI